MRPAVFLDRDDTLIANRAVTAGTAFPGDLFDPRLVRLLPGVVDGLVMLADAGFALVVVSNQGGLSQGRGTLGDIERVNDAMRALLREGGVTLAGVYMAPARTPASDERFANDPFRWRKPGPGMIEAAGAELGLHLPASWMVGDAARDVDAGIAAGLHPERCLLVGTHRLPGVREAAAEIVRAAAPNRATFHLSPVGGVTLTDPVARRTVQAAALAIAERTGIRVVAIEVAGAGVTVEIEGDELLAVGFAAELRRATESWYASRHPGVSLWGLGESRDDGAGDASDEDSGP